MRRMKVVTVVICIALLCFIWGNSLLPGSFSTGQSMGVADALIKDPALASSFEPLLRKLAHLLEFTALGGMLFLCFVSFSLPLGRCAFLSACAGILCACIDEGIQLFIPGRSAMVQDILLDSGGVLLGVAGGFFVCWMIRQIKKRKKS